MSNANDRLKTYGDVAKLIASGRFGTALPKNATLEEVQQQMLDDHRMIGALPLSSEEELEAFLRS